MYALLLMRYGKSASIDFADIPRPVPKPDELLVEAHAAGLNPIDNMIPKGMFKPILPYRLPITLGSNLAGVVDAAFARARGMNVLMQFVLGLLSRKIISQAKKCGAHYSFLFVRPDGGQLAELGKLLTAGVIRPVIDKAFLFAEIKRALAYLDQGRSNGKVVVQVK